MYKLVVEKSILFRQSTLEHWLSSVFHIHTVIFDLKIKITKKKILYDIIDCGVTSSKIHKRLCAGRLCTSQPVCFPVHCQWLLVRFCLVCGVLTMCHRYHSLGYDKYSIGRWCGMSRKQLKSRVKGCGTKNDNRARAESVVWLRFVEVIRNM